MGARAVRTALFYSVGAASLWTMMRFSTFYTLFTPMVGSERFSDVYVNQCFALFMLTVSISCIGAMLYRSQLMTALRSSRLSSVFLGIGSAFGFLLVDVFCHTGGASEVVLGVGVFLAAIFTTMLFILWGVRVMMEARRSTTVYFAGMICVACAILALVALSSTFAVAFSVIGPLVSGVGYYAMPDSSREPEDGFGMQQVKAIDWKLLLPVILLMSLSSMFNKLISSASSALIEDGSRLLTDVITIALFAAVIVYATRKPDQREFSLRFFIVSVIVMLLGLLIVVLKPLGIWDFVGGSVLMVSFYCFCYLALVLLQQDHVKAKASPVILVGIFVFAAVVFPLTMSNTVIYSYALALQSSGMSYSLSVAAMLSFLVTIIVFATLGSIAQTRNPEKGEEKKREKACGLVAKDKGLSPREQEVLLLLYEGRSRKKISELLVIAPSTTQAHISHIYTKLDIHKRDELIDLINDYKARIS